MSKERTPEQQELDTIMHNAILRSIMLSQALRNLHDDMESECFLPRYEVDGPSNSAPTSPMIGAEYEDSVALQKGRNGLFSLGDGLFSDGTHTFDSHGKCIGNTIL